VDTEAEACRRWWKQDRMQKQEQNAAGDSKLIYYVVINNTWTYLQGIQRGKNADPSAGASIQRCGYKEIRLESVH